MTPTRHGSWTPQIDRPKNAWVLVLSEPRPWNLQTGPPPEITYHKEGDAKTRPFSQLAGILPKSLLYAANNNPLPACSEYEEGAYEYFREFIRWVKSISTKTGWSVNVERGEGFLCYIFDENEKACFGCPVLDPHCLVQGRVRLTKKFHRNILAEPLTIGNVLYCTVTWNYELSLWQAHVSRRIAHEPPLHLITNLWPRLNKPFAKPGLIIPMRCTPLISRALEELFATGIHYTGALH